MHVEHQRVKDLLHGVLRPLSLGFRARSKMLPPAPFASNRGNRARKSFVAPAPVEVDQREFSRRRQTVEHREAAEPGIAAGAPPRHFAAATNEGCRNVAKRCISLCSDCLLGGAVQLTCLAG